MKWYKWFHMVAVTTSNCMIHITTIEAKHGPIAFTAIVSNRFIQITHQTTYILICRRIIIHRYFVSIQRIDTKYTIQIL